MRATVALKGDGTCIAQARRLAVGFLTQAQSGHGVPVSQRAMDLTQLVDSELVANARKYAPGPVLMDLRVVGETVEVVLWDSDPVLPIARAADVGRVGQHGLESGPLAGGCSTSHRCQRLPPASFASYLPLPYPPIGSHWGSGPRVMVGVLTARWPARRGRRGAAPPWRGSVTRRAGRPSEDVRCEGRRSATASRSPSAPRGRGGLRRRGAAPTAAREHDGHLRQGVEGLDAVLRGAMLSSDASRASGTGRAAGTGRTEAPGSPRTGRTGNGERRQRHDIARPGSLHWSRCRGGVGKRGLAGHQVLPTAPTRAPAPGAGP
jgi:hypothetical protein